MLRCDGCGTVQLAYNSCKNRHCPKCQSSAAKRWLDARQSDLLPVEYFHVVFTLPAPIADIAVGCPVGQPLSRSLAAPPLARATTPLRRHPRQSFQILRKRTGKLMVGIETNW